jgi:outer membrane protein assembly factor BamB
VGYPRGRAVEPYLPGAAPRRLLPEAFMTRRWPLLAAVWLLTIPLAALAADWPQWRGPDRMDVSMETGLLKAWPKAGPPLLWKSNNLGIGFSGPAIVGDRLYTMGARDEVEYVLALDANNGKELWHTKLGPIFTFEDNRWGDGPRGTPSVDRNHLYALGAQGELVCVQVKDGKEVWRKNLIKDFGGKVMHADEPLSWGYCESPLLDGDQLVCCPGGPQGTMIALDKKTGTILWRTTDLKDEATDSSIMPAVIDGTRQYVQTTFKGSPEGGAVVGVAARDGKVLWVFPISRYNDSYAIVPTPIVRGNLVYVAAGYNAGCDLLEITRDSKGVFKAKDLYSSRSQKVMQNEHGGVVLVGDYLYGYSDGKGWVCQDFKTGKLVWNEKYQLDGKGSLTCADGHLYFYSDEGIAALLKPSPKGWEESGRFALPEKAKVPEIRKSSQSAHIWTHPVVANGRLYLRDQELLFCFDVRDKK